LGNCDFGKKREKPGEKRDSTVDGVLADPYNRLKNGLILKTGIRDILYKGKDAALRRE
jgi:hypothetical protein